MNVRFSYADGMTAAFKKFAVSGSMYARALSNAAQRAGGRIAPQVLSQVGGQARATASPFLSQQARAPGALTPTAGQQEVQGIMNKVPFASADNGFFPGRSQARLNNALDRSGRSFSAPGLNQQLVENFGPTPGQESAFADTLVGHRRTA